MCNFRHSWKHLAIFKKKFLIIKTVNKCFKTGSFFNSIHLQIGIQNIRSFMFFMINLQLI